MKQKKRDRSFPFLQVNQREPKPRTHGLTEIRGPYYSVVGRRYLEDLFELMAVYVDSLKFAGGSTGTKVGSALDMRFLPASLQVLIALVGP